MGKSSIIYRYLYDVFSDEIKSNTSFQVLKKNVTLNDHQIKIQLWQAFLKSNILIIKKYDFLGIFRLKKKIK